MRYLFTSGQSKQLDDHAINIIGFPGLVLMEKAAMTLVSVLMERESRDSGILSMGFGPRWCWWEIRIK